MIENVARPNCRGSWQLGTACGKCPRCEATRPAIAAMTVQAEPVAKRWQIGDKVRKKRGSSWRGTVCGFYTTPHTPEGYCVDSAFEPGSVQVWPEAALEDWDGVMVEDELRAEITRLTEALQNSKRCRMTDLDDHALQTSAVVSHESGNMSDKLERNSHE